MYFFRYVLPIRREELRSLVSPHFCCYWISFSGCLYFPTPCCSHLQKCPKHTLVGDTTVINLTGKILTEIALATFDTPDHERRRCTR